MFIIFMNFREFFLVVSRMQNLIHALYQALVGLFMLTVMFEMRFRPMSYGLIPAKVAKVRPAVGTIEKYGFKNSVVAPSFFANTERRFELLGRHLVHRRYNLKSNEADGEILEREESRRWERSRLRVQGGGSSLVLNTSAPYRAMQNEQEDAAASSTLRSFISDASHSGSWA